MIDDESLNNIERLHKLKADGVITEADFEAAKQKLLLGQRTVKSTSSALNAELADNDWFGWATLPLKKYADFTGRASRKEFWLFFLLLLLAFFAGAIISTPMGEEALGGIIALIMLSTLVPSLALTVRRFHDQDKSGWFALLNLIPYVGWLVVTVFMIIEGTRGDNRFGPDPRQR